MDADERHRLSAEHRRQPASDKRVPRPSAPSGGFHAAASARHRALRGRPRAGALPDAHHRRAHLRRLAALGRGERGRDSRWRGRIEPLALDVRSTHWRFAPRRGPAGCRSDRRSAGNQEQAGNPSLFGGTRLDARRHPHRARSARRPALGGARLLDTLRRLHLRWPFRPAVAHAVVEAPRRPGIRSVNAAAPERVCKAKRAVGAEVALRRPQSRGLQLGGRRADDRQGARRPRRDGAAHRVAASPRSAAHGAAVQGRRTGAEPIPVHGQLQHLEEGRHRRSQAGCRPSPRAPPGAMGRRGAGKLLARHHGPLRLGLADAQRRPRRSSDALHLHARSDRPGARLFRLRRPGRGHRWPVRPSGLAGSPAERPVGRLHGLHQPALRRRCLGRRIDAQTPHRPWPAHRLVASGMRHPLSGTTDSRLLRQWPDRHAARPRLAHAASPRRLRVPRRAPLPGRCRRDRRTARGAGEDSRRRALSGGARGGTPRMERAS